MKKLFLFLSFLFCSASMMAQNYLELPYPIRLVNPKPIDFFYYEADGTVWDNTTEVITNVPSALRYRGQTFNVNGIEYWFGAGITNGDLVIKIVGVTDGDKGDITVSGGTWSIDPGAVTLNKLQDINSNFLIGRTAAGPGQPGEVEAYNTLALTEDFGSPQLVWGAGPLKMDTEIAPTEADHQLYGLKFGLETRQLLYFNIYSAAGLELTSANGDYFHIGSNAFEYSTIGSGGPLFAINADIVAYFGVPVKLPNYATADLPGVTISSIGPGALVYDTDEEIVKISDGVSWNALVPSGGGSPGGSSFDVQYNDSGSFGGVSAGTEGQILTYHSGSAPTWEDAPSGGGASDAEDVTYVPAGTIAATNVQAAIVEFDNETQASLSGKQAVDSDLNAIAALTATNDDIIQRKSGAWTNRSLSQYKTDLSLNNVENTALSTWAGSANITGVGTVTSGTWNGTDIVLSRFAQGSGLSVLGVPGSSTADHQSIAGTANQVLRVNSAGTSLGFGTLGDVNFDAARALKYPATRTVTGSTTAVIGDAGGYIEVNSASNTTVTIPPASSINYPDNTTITIHNFGAGTITLTEGADVVFLNQTGGTLDIEQYSAAVVKKRTGNAWYAWNGTTPPASGVESVSGTTDRITSSGGTDPVIDISATFEATLVKKTGNETIAGVKTFSSQINLPGFATGSLPTASSNDEAIAHDTSIKHPVFSNGTTWQPVGFTDPDVAYYENDDFLWGLTSGMSAVSPGWIRSISGSGADVYSTNFGVDATENAAGVIGIDCGTTTTGRSLITKGAGAILLGHNSAMRLGFRVALSALSDGTDTYTAYVGFTDAGSSGDGTDGAFFRYTHSVNGGEWQAVTRNNGTETGSATDTNVAPAAGVFDRMEIRPNAAGTSVDFLINDTVVATNTTNIPTGSGRQTGLIVKIEKSAGTTSRIIYLDWYKFMLLRTAGR